MIWDDQKGKPGSRIKQNHMAAFLSVEAVTDFGKDLNSFPAGNIGKNAHSIFDKLNGYILGAVNLVGNFKMMFFRGFKISADGLTDVGHGFGNILALGHASRQAGAFSNIAVIFGIINKIDFDFHDSFLLDAKYIITFLRCQPRDEIRDTRLGLNYLRGQGVL